MAIDLKKVFIEQNDNEIKRYEMLIKYTNKSVLRNKHIKNYNRHVSAKSNITLIMKIISEQTHMLFLKEMKKYGLIKRLK